MWLCRCVCGNEKIIARDKIVSGKTVSCGCRRYRNSHPATIHGLSHTPEYHAWSGAKARCYKPSTPRYRYYGGRGVKVCVQWLNDFAMFLSDMGPRPSSDHCLARLNNDGDYEPGNCHWSLLDYQKMARKVCYVDFHGEKVILSNLCQRYGISRILARSRIRRGWAVEDAVTIPAGDLRRVNKHL